MLKLNALLILAAVSLIFGCTVVPYSIDGSPLQKLASLDNQQVFAGTRDGALLAFGHAGLNLSNVASENVQKISKSSPSMVAWNQAGDSLAAVFPRSDFETHLIQFSRDGDVLQQIDLPIAASALKWTMRGDLLLAGYRLEVFSFGSNLQQHLYRIAGGKAEQIVLSDTTLKPGLSRKLKRRLAQFQPVLFSEPGDEFFYLSVHDPPEFPPYMNLNTMHWQAGDSRVLLKLPMQEVKLWQSGRIDSVVVTQGEKTFSINSWPQVEGTNSDGSFAYSFIDGQLFNSDQLLADWGPDSRLQILADGRYLLALSETLFMGSGLRPTAGTQYSKMSWMLRRWRAAGLISLAEYLEKLKDIQ